MKKLAILLVALGLFTSVSSVWAAGSASGGSTKVVETVEEPAAETVSEAVVEHVEATATDAIPPEEVIAPDGSSAAEYTKNNPEAAAGLAPVVTSETTEKKLCHDGETLKERVECRLKKSVDEIDEELDAVFMPEECRAMEDEDKKSLCVDRYRAVQACWKQPIGNKRIACVKDKLEIDKLLPVDVYCEGKQKGCAKQYRWKVFNLITFRFYDAEERAEKWYEEGYLDLETTRDFVTFIVESKVDFYNKNSSSARKAIIKDVMKEWDLLVAKVKVAKAS